MKNFLILFILLIPLYSFSEQRITIQFKFKETDKTEILYVKGENNFDSAQINNGYVKFIIKKESNNPELYQIYTKGYEFKFGLFVEDSNISISGSFSNPQELRVEGSKTQEEMKYYFDKTQPLRSELINLVKQNSSNDLISRQKLKIQEAEIDFINKYPLSYVSVNIPWYTFMQKIISASEAIKWLESLPNGKYDKIRDDNIVSIRKTVFIKDGNVAKDFQMKDYKSGKEVSLSHFKNQTIVLNFWSSSCGPCLREIGVLKQFTEDIKNKDVIVISISLDSKKEELEKAISKFDMTWIVLCDFLAENSEPVLNYGINSLPENFIISKEGKVYRTSIDSKQQLEKLIEENGE